MCCIVDAPWSLLFRVASCCGPFYFLSSFYLLEIVSLSKFCDGMGIGFMKSRQWPFEIPSNTNQWFFSVLYRKRCNTINSSQILFISDFKSPQTLSIPLLGPPSGSLSHFAHALFPVFPLYFRNTLKQWKYIKKWLWQTWKYYIFSFLNPFRSGSYCISAAPRFPLYFVK